MPPRFSICITNKNKISTIGKSMGRILSQVDRSYEIVVVDSESTDGSLEYLRQLESLGKIRLIVKQCSRGMGRQIAFQNSTADLVIASVDTDVVYRDGFGGAITEYLEKYMGKIFFGYGIMVATRDSLNSIGGWRDLYELEDLDLVLRSLNAGICCYDRRINAVESHESSSYRGLLSAARTSLRRNRDLFRLGVGLGDLRLNRRFNPMVLLGYFSHFLYGDLGDRNAAKWFRTWEQNEYFCSSGV